MDTRIDPSQLFLTGSALETVCQWSNILKSFQQHLSPHFARQEAPVRCLQLYSSAAQPYRTEKWMANGGTDW
jgi:hypothetical protein